MRVTRGLIAATLAVVFALTLGGCVPQSHKAAPPTPSPSSTPVFASDEEALAAATKAYAAYLKVSDEIAQDGGKNPERLAPYVTENQLASEDQAFAKFLESGKRQSGYTKVRSVKIQEFGMNHSGRVVVGAYVCADITDLRLIDIATGASANEGHESFVAVEVSLEGDGPDSARLLVARSVPWPGTGVC